MSHCILRGSHIHESRYDAKMLFIVPVKCLRYSYSDHNFLKNINDKSEITFQNEKKKKKKNSLCLLFYSTNGCLKIKLNNLRSNIFEKRREVY